jgi:maltooligosyltrehalose trehalohydrolase
MGYYSDFGMLEDLATTLSRGYRYAGDYSRHRGRRHGRPSPGLDGRRLLGYLQNHDQVGNRAGGERSGELMSPGRVLIGAAIALTAPFVPMLFQGEEWSASTPFLYFTDHDAELGRAVSNGRREGFAPFGWDPESIPDPQDPETFRRSKLRWEEVSEPNHERVLDWYRALIELRTHYPELTDGNLAAVEVNFDEDASWLSYARGRVAVAFNLGEHGVHISVAGDRLALASAEGVQVDDRAIDLPPDSVAVVVRA